MIFEIISIVLLALVFIFLIFFEIYITFAEKKHISLWQKIPMLSVVVFIQIAIFIITAIQVLSH